MSLVCWLPLDGNLNQQGASNIEATSTNLTLNTSGKIGSCYSFNGSNSYITLLEAPFSNSTTEFSYTCWAKFTSLSSSCLFSNRTATQYTGITIFVNNSGNILFDAGNERRTKSYTFATNIWYHLAFTYKKGDKKKIYINGTEIDSITSTGSTTTASATNAFIGASQNSNTTVNANYLNGQLNDVRIYDHCLSAAEVHEISQGLVLHYKLDKPANINNNLYVGSEKFTGSWSNSGNWTTSAETFQNFVVKERSGSWSGLYQGINCTVGDIYTISFWGKVENGGRIQSIHRSNLGNVTTGLTIIDGNFSTGHYWVDTAEDGSNWKRYWGTVRIDSEEVTQLRWRLENGISGKLFSICGIKMERGPVATEWSYAASESTETNIIQDSSGYNHNGTITGTITLDSNTPRYSASSTFNGTERINAETLGADIRTLSCWCKTTKNKSTSQHMVADSFSNMCISFYNGTIIGVFGTTRSTGSKSTLGTSYKENDWNHIVVVKTDDAGARDIYCNGVKLTPTSNDYWSAATGFFIGARNNTNGNAFYGNISDVRAYCTALSAADIKQLYEVGAKVDNKGNLHTYEINEHGQNKLKKTGVFYNYASEPYIQLSDGSYWKLLLFHYVDNGKNLFTSATAAYNDGFGLYSRLRDIDKFKYNNLYEFYVIQDGIEHRWSQTNAPLTTTSVTGFTSISGSPSSGICKCNGNTLLARTSTTSNWWNAAGCWTKFSTGGKTGIPGFGTNNAAGMCTEYLALYARIDEITYKTASNNHYANNLIEF